MKAQIAAACSALQLPASDAQCDALARYVALLQRWNRTYNLTAVRDEQEMLTQHLADCLAVVAPLQRFRAGGRLLDVGSGGGLPGVVLAVMAPAWQVTCCDTVGKKAAFVQQVAGALALPNLQSRHARVEQLCEAPFDVITCRAFSSLADLVRLTAPLLAETGVWMAMKGRRPDEEIAALPASARVFHVEPLQVPGLDAERCLVWLRPTETALTSPG